MKRRRNGIGGSGGSGLGSGGGGLGGVCLGGPPQQRRGALLHSPPVRRDELAAPGRPLLPGNAGQGPEAHQDGLGGLDPREQLGDGGEGGAAAAGAAAAAAAAAAPGSREGFAAAAPVSPVAVVVVARPRGSQRPGALGRGRGLCSLALGLSGGVELEVGDLFFWFFIFPLK